MVMPLQRSKKPRSSLDPPALLDYAVKSLSSKMKSVRDLRRKLADRAEPGEAGQVAIEAVILKLKDLGYLSDERFAAEFTRSRQENDKFGRRRVQQQLFQKGIASDLSNKTLTAAYADVDELVLAKQYVQRKRMKPPANEKETARAMRRLIAAGFTTKTVWKVLRNWNLEIEEVEVDEFSIE
jgi:regulatory protein